MNNKGTLLAIACAFFLVGCEEAVEAPAKERIRAIKSYTVNEPAGVDLRRYSGSLIASDTSDLSFPVSGTVQTVKVSEGDQVKAGQVLVTLDPTPFELDVQAAEAELASSEARYNEKFTELDRQTTLYNKGWVAKAALDQAQAGFNSARAELDLKKSHVGSAKRDLKNAVLVAPFDGMIADRDVEPFEEVSTGAPLLQINSKGAIEIEFSIPDTVVSRLAIGTSVQIEVEADENCGCTGVLSEIGSASSTVNAVTVKAALLETNVSVIPGMAAEVLVPVVSDNAAGGYLVPISAIAPGDDKADGYLFKFDAASGQVQKVAIHSEGEVRDNQIVISKGIAAGDIIASAGVSFLRHGQVVKLMEDQ